MFRNREEAAERLAGAVASAGPVAAVVLALPRGGVPLGAVVAARLGAPLDLVLVRKIGMPGHEELAAGAMVGGAPPVVMFNDRMLAAYGLKAADFELQIARLAGEIERRRTLYLKDRAPVPVAGRTAIIVDDGIATGATVRASVAALRARGPAAVWVAVPVAPGDTVAELESLADRVICLEVPSPFWAVGAHYRDFREVPDAEVVRLLEQAG